MKLIHDETKAALQKATEQMKTQYDKKKKASKKLDNKHVGPFPILKKHRLSTYKLKLPPIWKIYPIFNETLLTPYTPPVFPNQEQPPPPLLNIIQGKKEYDVESILDDKPHKVHRKKGEPSKIVTDYLVKWKGYGLEENKWTTEKFLGNAKEVIANYLKSKKGAVTVQAIVVEPKTATVIIDTK
ncbi:uncharacterized protein ARMOST_12670 [Armillaria ostoyae]|uniref:Chromo domain-containing protein n=1 Tax=Armillaria ostoyae TaxID=47428 RepID=A0A284RKK7_ARMOS|nr:uncharacterized protein ARMOST_12670 [Armillaria ostoyae]